MMTNKRAAIYVRVSSERQAIDKISPDAQEADCKDYCMTRGYTVVDIYRDIKKYRAGGRLVEPSGTRSDRPHLKHMLADARNGKFEVIVAWREDRLYRGYRPMLDVLDCMDETHIEIELVKETFDKRLAPVKAWAARMELDARQDRITMGIAGRLDSGKVWSTSIPYGYRLNITTPEIDPIESIWVCKIWEWYADRVPLREIRQRLLEGGAPQRSAGKIPWQIPWLYAILKKDVYVSGVQLMKWKGQVYEIQYPPLIDPDLARRVQRRRERSKEHPARNIKYNYLGLGVVYCAACNVKMSSFTTKAYKNGKPTNRMIRDYRCGYFLHGYHQPSCPHRISVKRLDAQLWEKVLELLSDRKNLEEVVEGRLEELRRQEVGVQSEIDRLNDELDRLIDERQWVITKARKGTLNESDLEYQLGVLMGQEKLIKMELADKNLLVGDRSKKLLEFIEQYRRRLAKGIDWAQTEPKTPKEEEKQYKARRKIVEAIVSRVDVFEDKSIKVEFVFDLSEEKIKETPPWWQ